MADEPVLSTFRRKLLSLRELVLIAWGAVRLYFLSMPLPLVLWDNRLVRLESRGFKLLEARTGWSRVGVAPLQSSSLPPATPPLSRESTPPPSREATPSARRRRSRSSRKSTKMKKSSILLPKNLYVITKPHQAEE